VHKAGMLHRDIKPDNIYIKADGNPMLIDFGAARMALGQKSRSLSVVVSEGYAPKEQYSTRGKQGVWTDLYGIGASLYRCISGKGCDDDEREHTVRVGDFWLGKYEVTVGEYKACMRAGACKAPDEGYEEYSPSDRHPIQRVSWHDAVAYADWLSAETGKRYRLPTEAEWEYAARAGTSTAYSWGDQIGSNRANCDNDYCGDSYQYTAPVGSFPANAWGLHDMHGNVYEWTCSKYVEDYDGSEQGCISKNDANYSSAFRVLRGGSWGVTPRGLRSANRSYGGPSRRDYDGGFRLARTR